MLFPTLTFALFFIAVFAGNYLLCSEEAGENMPRKIFLLLASYIFYCTWDPSFLVLLVAATLFNYGIGLAIDSPKLGHLKKARYWILTFGVVSNLGLLALYKYYDFFREIISTTLGLIHIQSRLPLLDFALPLGISFFTFQNISYIVDVYQKRLRAEKNPLDVMLFVAFFPHLVSGPIVRAADFINQLKKKVDPENVDYSAAFFLIGTGLFKKMLLASVLSVALVDPVFLSPGDYSAWDLLLALYGYAMQIYCDFSGYSDIAIGLAKLLGYRFPENFNQPYRAQSIQDFWHRWHMSLSTWLRDYLYIPLGGSRGEKWLTYRNLFLTMFIGGLWHGASWNFVFWGALHGSYLTVEKYLNQSSSKEKCLCWKDQLVSTLITFHCVCFAWIFFRCTSWDKSIEFLRGFTQWDLESKKVTLFNILILATAASLHFLPNSVTPWITATLKRTPIPVLGLALGAILAVFTTFAPEGIASFIYFRF